MSSLTIPSVDAYCRPRRLLVLINPKSGKGKSLEEFHNHIQPIFELADITFNVIVTSKWQIEVEIS